MIQFTQVSKRYPSGYQALSDINFSLEQGEMVFLTGHSGAGKSTFLKLIALLDRPSAGQIVVNGVPLNQMKKQAIAGYRQSIGITMQSPHLLSDRTVFENVALPLRIQGVPAQVIDKRVPAAIDKVGLLKKIHMLPSHLSGGEQQRVSIARAVVHKPMLLLADEPTGNLDPELSAEVMRLYEEFNQAGVCVLVATHDLALIAGMRHRIVMLREGKLC